MMARVLNLFSFIPSLSKFCQARVNILLFRFLPFWTSRCYLTVLGKIYFLFNRKEKQLISRTLTFTLAGGVWAEQVRAMQRRTFQGIIDHYHEKMFAAFSSWRKVQKFWAERVRWAGEEELQQALAAGRGVIAVTGHFGAVEFLPGVMALKGYPVSIICRFKTSRLRDSLLQRAQDLDVNIIDGDDGNVFLAAVKALKSGRIIITECDEFEEWRTNGGQKLNFLGRRLLADKTLEILRKRSGSPVVSALVQRHGGRRYTLNLAGIALNGNGAQGPVGARCLEVLERAVLADPPQWYQWKQFGKMIYEELEVGNAHHEPGYLAPEAAVSLPLQA